jgi:hypothetical protein
MARPDRYLFPDSDMNTPGPDIYRTVHKQVQMHVDPFVDPSPGMRENFMTPCYYGQKHPPMYYEGFETPSYYGEKHPQMMLPNGVGPVVHSSHNGLTSYDDPEMKFERMHERNLLKQVTERYKPSYKGEFYSMNAYPHQEQHHHLYKEGVHPSLIKEHLNPPSRMAVAKMHRHNGRHHLHPHPNMKNLMPSSMKH